MLWWLDIIDIICAGSAEYRVKIPRSKGALVIDCVVCRPTHRLAIIIHTLVERASQVLLKAGTDSREADLVGRELIYRAG